MSYEQDWLDCQDLDPYEDLEEELYLSVDLEEATYTMPADLLELNVENFDAILVGFRPWTVFRELFTSFERKVDMTHLIEKGYWQGPEEVTSIRGSFMGDALSFIHLTALLTGVVRAACIATKVPRPMGQSVGDDLLLLKAKRKTALAFREIAVGVGCKFSKLDSLSVDSATFCEQYVAEVSDIDTIRDLQPFEHSIFGKLVYLDVIKGSILSGRSKVKADGSSPFFGHANMLNKQIQYAPLHTTKVRSKTFLWAKNFVQAAKLGSSMASLPQVLGGIDMAVGPIVSYNDAAFQANYLPWYESLLDLSERDFLRYFLLLKGIYYANPKGYPWLNDIEVIKDVVANCNLIKADNIDQLLPEYLHGKPIGERFSFISKELNLISFTQLSSLLARQDAFLKTWNGEVSPSFMTLSGRNARQRANKAWGIIKSEIAPKAREKFQSRTMSHLRTLFESRTWGLYVRKDDQAIIDCFGGMPTLFIDFST